MINLWLFQTLSFVLFLRLHQHDMNMWFVFNIVLCYWHCYWLCCLFCLIRVTIWRINGIYTWQRMEGFPWQVCRWPNVNTLQMLLLIRITMSAETRWNVLLKRAYIFGEYYTNHSD
jgi:hypothetical protein